MLSLPLELSSPPPQADSGRTATAVSAAAASNLGRRFTDGSRWGEGSHECANAIYWDLRETSRVYVKRDLPAGQIPPDAVIRSVVVRSPFHNATKSVNMNASVLNTGSPGRRASGVGSGVASRMPQRVGDQFDGDDRRVVDAWADGATAQSMEAGQEAPTAPPACPMEGRPGGVEGGQRRTPQEQWPRRPEEIPRHRLRRPRRRRQGEADLRELDRRRRHPQVPPPRPARLDRRTRGPLARDRTEARPRHGLGTGTDGRVPRRGCRAPALRHVAPHGLLRAPPRRGRRPALGWSRHDQGARQHRRTARLRRLLRRLGGHPQEPQRPPHPSPSTRRPSPS
ncbi:hypothetical protein SUDANB21_02880 [Streptomyces sp. enrichment culture]